ncbi:MAG: alkaline phosphatase D family protein [Myxococcales bacterium]|nr:alkaline phosphatase D family protein [Myxococcales bacterium]
MTLTRRQWLLAVGAAGAATQLGGCGDPPPAVTAMVLEVEATRALVSAWAADADRGELVVTTAAGAEVAALALAFDEHGHAHVDVDGLSPATAYRAQVRTDAGAEHGPIAFVTAPADDDPRPLRLAVSADVDESRDHRSPIFDAIAAAAPELFVCLGDWPYADHGDTAFTRDQYDARHARGHLTALFQPWMRASSFRAIYDDHEFANDWDGAARALDPDRHAAALAAWDAWFPHRGDGPRYRSWRWGLLCECFLLDCRAYRSANDAPDGPTKTMLGAEQRAWLVDGLRASTATFKLVFTSVPLDYGVGVDHWATFAVERDGILDELAAAGVAGLLFLSADQHWFAAHRHRHGIREFQVGPLAHYLLEQPPLPDGVLARVSELNFGMIEITAEPRLRFRAFGATGDQLYDESFTPAELTPAPPDPWPQPLPRDGV